MNQLSRNNLVTIIDNLGKLDFSDDLPDTFERCSVQVTKLVLEAQQKWQEAEKLLSERESCLDSRSITRRTRFDEVLKPAHQLTKQRSPV